MKKLIIILAAMASICSCCCNKPSTKVIAHRGWWVHEGSAQNSLASMRFAMEAGFYGTEMDTQMTSDSVLIVFHDSRLHGKKIHSLTYAEVLADTTLRNGEKVSTFAEYLDEFLKIDSPTKLIVEIKKQKGDDWQTTVAEKVHAEVAKRDIKPERLEYISFSSTICDVLCQIAPEFDVAYLNGDMDPAQAKAHGYDGVDYYYDVIYKHHEPAGRGNVPADESKFYPAAFHAEGMYVNVWTVDWEGAAQDMIDMGVDFITTNYPDMVTKLLK